MIQQNQVEGSKAESNRANQNKIESKRVNASETNSSRYIQSNKGACRVKQCLIKSYKVDHNHLSYSELKGCMQIFRVTQSHTEQHSKGAYRVIESEKSSQKVTYNVIHSHTQYSKVIQSHTDLCSQTQSFIII